MAAVVETDLILDFLTEAQSIRYVPYTLVVEGLSVLSMFEQDQFNDISFRLIDYNQTEAVTRVFIEGSQRLLAYYDPFHLSEIDDRDLFSLYSNPVFGIKTDGADLSLTESLRDVMGVFKITPTIDELLLNETLIINAQDVMHISDAKPEIECLGTLHLYDPYLLTDFDPDTLTDMYEITFFGGKL